MKAFVCFFDAHFTYQLTATYLRSKGDRLYYLYYLFGAVCIPALGLLNRACQ